MFTLDFVTEKNKREAIEILLRNGGQINFASALDNGVSEDTFCNADIDVDDDLPCIIVDYGNGPQDAYVLAAMVVDDNINILTYDPEENHTEWVETSVCCSYSENDVYLTIDSYDE